MGLSQNGGTGLAQYGVDIIFVPSFHRLILTMAPNIFLGRRYRQMLRLGVARHVGKGRCFHNPTDGSVWDNGRWHCGGNYRIITAVRIKSRWMGYHHHGMKMPMVTCFSTDSKNWFKPMDDALVMPLSQDYDDYLVHAKLLQDARTDRYNSRGLARFKPKHDSRLVTICGYISPGLRMQACNEEHRDCTLWSREYFEKLHIIGSKTHKGVVYAHVCFEQKRTVQHWADAGNAVDARLKQYLANVLDHHEETPEDQVSHGCYDRFPLCWADLLQL